MGEATRLFEHANLTRSWYPQYDVSPDGQQFIVSEPFGDETAEPKINVVLNWQEEFRDRQPE